ncbi:MAG: GNAT family N-acetyltransferase, partial [Acidimicrobiales bacterium]
RELIRRFLAAATAPDGATAGTAPQGSAGRACVRSLCVGDRLAASQICCTVGRTLVLLKVAYLDALADLSPGNLAMADLVRQCCADPEIDRIDLVTAQPWHDRWHPTRHPTYQTRDFNLGRPAGLVGRVGDQAVAALRAARRRLGPRQGPAHPSDGLPIT